MCITLQANADSDADMYDVITTLQQQVLDQGQKLGQLEAVNAELKQHIHRQDERLANQEQELLQVRQENQGLGKSLVDLQGRTEYLEERIEKQSDFTKRHQPNQTIQKGTRTYVYDSFNTIGSFELPIVRHT